MSVKRPTIIGCRSGLVIGVVILLFAWLNDEWDNEILRSIINFLGSVPTLVFGAKFNISGLLQNISFFIYWVLLGGIVGWLVSQKHPLFKGAMLILIAGLFILHRMVQVNLERELEAAMETLYKAFIAKVHIEKIKP